MSQDGRVEPASLGRTTDSGETWRFIHQEEQMQSFSFVTRDGAHVLLEQTNDGIVAMRASHNGGPLYISDDGWTYRRLALP
jgi:hypothetical protein